MGLNNKFENNRCDTSITKTTNADKAESANFDVEISNGWSIRSLRRHQTVDQIFHFSVFACLIILACYIIAVHTLLYYETQDTVNLRRQVKYVYTLNEHLENVVKLLRFRLDQVEKNVADLKTQVRSSEDHHHRRPRRSTFNPNTTTSQPPLKKLRRDRTKNIETVATQFRTSIHSAYRRDPMEGVLGPWFVGEEFNYNMDAFGAKLKFYDRKIQILRAGLYFIYSQVTYDNDGVLNSYSINVMSTNKTGNTTNTSVAQCNAIGPRNYPTEISCYTSTIRILKPKDTVYLQQNSANRSIFFEDDMTFWGIILLSEP